MNLAALRKEVLDHGFDTVYFSAARINQYLNDANQLICSRVDYYADEATSDLTTANGVASFAFPADFGRIRSLRNTATQTELGSASLRDIDRSTAATGAPTFYALDGANIHLFPTPDNAYTLELRYWRMPADLVNDADVPTLPARWHWLLWKYTVAECYKAEDDFQTGNAWFGDFQNGLAMLAADLKFPSTDQPTQVRGMWDSGSGLSNLGDWSRIGAYNWDE